MEEWKEYRLGDICDTISDTYKGNSPQVVLINTSDVLEGKCLNHTPVPNKNLKGQFKKTFCNEDILYSEIRPANKRFAYIDFEPKDYIASTKLMVIRSKKEVLPKYLYYILQSNQMLDKLQTLAETRSGTFPQITFSELAAQKIILPGLNSQKKIVQVLESINSKIELNHRINENLEQQAQALFKSWFVDFEPFKDNKFIDSELGKIPEGWKVGKLNDLVKILSGFAFKSNTFVEKGKYQLITIKAVQDGQLNIAGANYINDIPPQMPQYCFLKKGDILLSLTGNVGRTCIVTYNHLLLNQRVAKIESLNCTNRMFIYTLLRQLEFKNKLISLARGTAQLNLSPIEMGQINIIIPSEKDLKKYSDIMNNSFDKILNNNVENIILSELRDKLLPKLMSGKFAITDINNKSL